MFGAKTTANPDGNNTLPFSNSRVNNNISPEIEAELLEIYHIA